MTTTTTMKRMRRRGGFKLGRKLVRAFRWVLIFRRNKNRNRNLYQQLSNLGEEDNDDLEEKLSHAHHISSSNNNNRKKKNNGNKKKAIFFSKVLKKWGRSIQRGAKELCFVRKINITNSTININSNNNDNNMIEYIRLGSGNSNPAKAKVPKGHLAVYVGDDEAARQRVLVPVMYLNHPLFEKLLKEAEDVYGFDQPGRISIPCPISEFLDVQTRIDSSVNGGAGVGCFSTLSLRCYS